MDDESEFCTWLLEELRGIAARLRTDLPADMRQDIAQEATIKVWKMVDRGRKDHGDITRSYLWRVAHSALMDEIQRRGRRPEEPAEPGDFDLQKSEAVGPDRKAAGHELGQRIQACLGRLGVPRRRAVVLYLEGHRVQEAATVLGWSYKETENRVYRGLAQLREWLAQD